MSYTPGPWTATLPDGSYHDVIRIFAAADPEGATPVAVCPQRNAAALEVLSGATNETTEAACNARLIAAAPELLEALRTARAAIKGDLLERFLIHRETKPAITLGDLLDAALAKATGGEQ